MCGAVCMCVSAGRSAMLSFDVHCMTGRHCRPVSAAAWRMRGGSSYSCWNPDLISIRHARLLSAHYSSSSSSSIVSSCVITRRRRHHERRDDCERRLACVRSMPCCLAASRRASCVIAQCMTTMQHAEESSVDFISFLRRYARR